MNFELSHVFGLRVDAMIALLESMSTHDFWTNFLAQIQSETSQTSFRSDSSLERRFASSEFFDASRHPTISDQVSLCRQIARQLVSDDENKSSKGREMFEKRVQNSKTWTKTESTSGGGDAHQNSDDDSEDFHERTISSEPNLRLLLDPRHVTDYTDVMETQEELEAFEQTRDPYRHLAEELKRETLSIIGANKGKLMFDALARKSESDGWAVDADIVAEVTEAVNAAAARQLVQRSATVAVMPTPMAMTGMARTSLVAAESAAGRVLRGRDFNARARPWRAM